MARFLKLFLIILGVSFTAPARAQTPADADKGLTSKQISQKLAAAKKVYFANPDLDQLYKTLNELSGIKNSTTWIKTHPNDPSTLTFKEFQLSLIELAQADAFMNKCTKGQAILERKADGILNKLAANNRGKSSLGVCSANDKKDALTELDPETAILYDDHKAANDVKINPAVNMPTAALGIDEKSIRSLVYNNSTQAHSDFLGTKNVYVNAKQREMFGKAQEKEIQAKVDNVMVDVKKTRAWIDAHESSAQTDEYVRKKYGFDIKDNEYSPEAIKRAKQLHQELMNGNRKNSLRNYLYFSQRFSFSGEPDLSNEKSDNYFGIESKALDMFGKAQHLTPEAHLTRNLPEYEEQELARFGQGAIKDMQNSYKGHYRMGEDDVLKMLAPALKEAGVSVANDNMVLQELQNEKIDAHMDAGLAGPKQQLNRSVQAGIMSGMTNKAVEAAKQKYMGTEVGFVLHTDAFKKYVASLRNGGGGADAARAMVQSAVKEMIKQTQDYASWVDVNQSDKNFFADDKGVWNYSKATELMMYSAPNTVQSIIAKNPQLLGSMCYPMQQAAKKRDMNPPSWVVWGGGAMSAIPGPAGMAANRIFGAVSAGFVIAEHNEKANALREQDKYTGLGDYILEKNWVESDADKKELKSVVKAHEDEINNTIITAIATEIVGQGINRAVTKGVARNQTVTEAFGKLGLGENATKTIQKEITAEMKSMAKQAEQVLGKDGALSAQQLAEAYVIKTGGSKLPIKQQLMSIGLYEKQADDLIAAGMFTAQAEAGIAKLEVGNVVKFHKKDYEVVDKSDLALVARNDGNQVVGKVKGIEGKGTKQLVVVEYTENGVTKTSKTPLKDTKFVSAKQVEKKVGDNTLSNYAVSAEGNIVQQQKAPWPQDVYSSKPEVVAFRTEYQDGKLLAKEENRYIEYFSHNENGVKTYARVKSVGEDGKLELEFLNGRKSEWVDPLALEGAQNSKISKKYFDKQPVDLGEQNMFGKGSTTPIKLTKDGKQIYLNPNNTETKVSKDGILGTGKNTKIDAKSKTIPYSNPNEVALEDGIISQDRIGAGGEIVGTKESKISRVVPNNKTNLGKYASAMEKKNTKVYLQADSDDFSSAGYSSEGRVIGTTVSETKGRVIALRKNTDDLVYRQRLMKHEGFHNEVKVKIEKGEETPWGSSFKTVNGRKSLPAGPRETINIGYNNRLSPEEINTYGKDFMSFSVIAHNRETSQAIDQAIKKMPGALSMEEKLARVKISYNTVIDDAAYRKELDYFREISGDAEASLKPFSDKLAKLKAGDASALTVVKSGDGKSLILTADNIEYTIPAKGVQPADYIKFADDHINRILSIKTNSMKVTDEIETLVETAKKQKYFDGNQYRDLKDKMAELTSELNGAPRVSNTQRLEDLKKAKDLEKATALPVRRSLDGPKGGSIDGLENAAEDVGSQQTGMITAPKKEFTVETRKNAKTIHGTVDGELNMKTYESEKNSSYLVVPDNNTKIGRMAKRLDEKDDTQILFSDKTLSQEQARGTVGNRKFTAYDNVVYKRNTMVVKSGGLTMHEQQVVRSHEAFHVRMMTWAKQGKETPYNSFFRALSGKQLKAPFSVYGEEMASEEVHAYAKDFVNASIKAKNRETVKLIEAQVKSMDQGLSRIEKLNNVQLSYKSVTDSKEFKFRYESVSNVTKSHLENVGHFEDNIKLWFKGESENVKVIKLGEDGFVKVDVDGVEMNFTGVPFEALKSNEALEKYLVGQTTKMKEIDKAVIENVGAANAVQVAAKKRGYYTGTEYYDLKNKMAKVGNAVDVNGWVPTADRLKQVAEDRANGLIESPYK